jgi:hypothetical protein
MNQITNTNVQNAEPVDGGGLGHLCLFAVLDLLGAWDLVLGASDAANTGAGETGAGMTRFEGLI